MFELCYIVLLKKFLYFSLFQRRTIDDLLLLSAVEEEEDSDVETLLLDLVAKEPRPFQSSFRIDLESLDDQECINLFRWVNKILSQYFAQVVVQ